jgi:ABC-type cobalt transport system substrate-binding protein
MNELSNFDIERIISQLDLQTVYNGCYSKDQLKELNRGFYIVNLQSSEDGNGTHWCCLYVVNPVYSIWFDSFGFPPPIEIESLLHNYDYNRQDIQNIDSSACGYYCIAFIKFMFGKTNVRKAFSTFIKLFNNNTKYNDKILEQMLFI